MDRQTLGRTGERLAASPLESKGYAILHRNVYTAQGELDLVARSPDGVIGSDGQLSGLTHYENAVEG